MKAVYQGFVGTTAEWEEANPVLYAGVWELNYWRTAGAV